MYSKENEVFWKAERRYKILEAGFRLFSEKGIESVTMPDIAEMGGVSRATLYRYYDKKVDVVIDVGSLKWAEYIVSRQNSCPQAVRDQMTGAEQLSWYLDSFLDLYRNHKDILCFNYNFNSYLRNEKLAEERKRSYLDLVDKLGLFFSNVYEKGLADGTIRADMTKESMFSSSFHIMLAAVTRYAVGLLYKSDREKDSENELIMLKEILLSRYTK